MFVTLQKKAGDRIMAGQNHKLKQSGMILSLADILGALAG
jgi:hypothetical protein